MDLAARVPAALSPHPAVRGVRLVGSRARDDATPLSDWDFGVDTHDFDAVAAALPELVVALEPLAQQWDPLGEHATYMLMLEGAEKVDLIFAEPQRASPPDRLDAQTLPAIDMHFWDWTLWLGAMRAAGRDDLVEAELAKMFDVILRGLGVESMPESLEQAVAAYVAALPAAEARFGVTLPRTLEQAVRRRLRL